MWTSEFRTALRSGHYHPKFRLKIGTYGIDWTAAGKPEETSPWVIEITSHGDASGEHDPYANYKAVRGLTEQISFGAQSVSVRSWEYSMATLSVGVTHDAASYALAARVGCLAKLECDLNGSGYNTIFLGQYLGMSWSSGSGVTTLQFRDALSYLQSRSTESEDSDAFGRSDWYNWFKGVGDHDYTTDSVTTPGTSAVASIVSGHMVGDRYDIDKNGLRHNYRHDDAFIRHSSDNNGYTEASGNRFAIVTPTDGDQFCLRYIRTQSSSIAAYIISPLNTQQFGYGTPTDSVMGTGSKIKAAFAVYGNPVVELANTMYVEGYNKHMVGSIFGFRHGYKPFVDFDEILKTADVFHDLWSSATTGFAYQAMRCLITSSARDGYAVLKSRFAKFGVFPRWKMGAYSVGFCGDPDNTYSAGLFAGTIKYPEIISMTWDQVDSSARPVYREVEFKSTDATGHAIGAGAGSNVNSGPIINQLVVNHSDVAAGETHGERYADWFIEQQYLPWYGHTPPMRCTVVVNNMRWAMAGLGETVKIEYPASATRAKGWRHRLIGPSKLNSDDTFTPIPGTPNIIWVIVSTHVDWVRGFVTLEMTAKHGPSKSYNRPDYFPE